MGIIPHFLLQCAFQLAFQRAFHFAFQNVFQPQPYCRLGFEKSVTPFPKSPRTHSVSEPEPQAAKSIVYRVPSPAPVACLIFRLSACRVAVCGITTRLLHIWRVTPIQPCATSTLMPHTSITRRPGMSARHARLICAPRPPRPAWHVRAMPDTRRLYA